MISKPKVISLFVPFVLFVHLVFGQFYQPIVEDGNQWNVKWERYDPTSHDYEKRIEEILFRNDTLINDTLYKNVYKRFHDEDTNFVLSGHIREEKNSGKVFIRLKGDGHEYLLYDFGMQTGDTARIISLYSGQELNTRVDSIDTVSVNGVNRYQYYLSVQCTFPEFNYVWYKSTPWIRGIGSKNGVLYSVINEDLGGRYFLELLCFKKDDSYYYWNEDIENCNLNNLNIQQTIETHQNFYYNQHSKELILQNILCKNIHLRIYDINGQIVFNQTNTTYSNTINVSFLSPGIYIARLISEKYTYTPIKFYKQK